MSHKKHQFWVMMPVLGLLLMSPKDIQSKYGRHIASDRDPAPSTEVTPQVQTESTTPKLDLLLKDVAIPEKQSPLNLNSDMLKEDISSLLSRVSKAEEFDKNTVEKPALDKLREDIKLSAIELRQVENSIKDLMNPEDVSDVPSRIAEAKIRLEASLKDLESTEALVAARPAPAITPAVETPVVATTTPAEPATPAPEVSTPAATSTPAQRAPSVVDAETTVATDGKKEEKDPILCALEEQNKLLQQTLQTFVQQQTTIMQQMMQMSQMMMMQSMYRTPDTFNYQQAYQYHQPMVAGNWVYYPNGLQPIQPGQTQNQPQQNMFGMQQPPVPYMPQMMGQAAPNMYSFPQPDMLNQGQGQWGLTPSSPFTHPQGNFGMESAGSGFTSIPMGIQPPAGSQAPASSLRPLQII
jgi:hypothetical protein